MELRSAMPGALGLLAASLSISLIWPQVWLCCHRRRTGGLSPTASFLSVALNLSWLTFGVLTRDPAQSVTNAVVGLGNTAVLIALLVTQPHLRALRKLARTAGAAAVPAAGAAGSMASVAVLGIAPAAVAAALGAVASVVAAASACVQPVSLLRDRTQDLSGLSRTRWWLSVGASSSWTAYGLLQDRPEVWASAAVGLGCALVVSGLLLAGRPAQPAGRSVLRSCDRRAGLRPGERRALAAAA
jgi:uncharacterized protein with PQ loop repeat